jgi:hypothetical protein
MRVLVRVRRTGARVIDPPDFWNRAFTVYSLVATTEGAGATPLASERRFSEVHTFHEAWVVPLMSLDCPVELPSDLEPIAFAKKNDADIVAERKIAIQTWANAALAMSKRVGSQVFTTALQLFLRGYPSPGPEEAAVMRNTWEAPTHTWDPAGAWIFHTAVDFGGETYTVPHRLELSTDGETAAFRAEGHPQGGGIMCEGKGTWKTVENGTAISVALTLEVTAPPTVDPTQSTATEPLNASLEVELQPKPAQTLASVAEEGGATDTPAAAATAAAAAETAAEAAAATAAPAQTVVLSTQECTMLLRKAFQPSTERALGEVEDTVNGWLDRPTNNTPEERRLIRSQCTVGDDGTTHTHSDPLIPIARHTVRKSTMDTGLSETLSLYFLPPAFQKPLDELAKVKKGGAAVAASVIFLLILL